MPRALAFAFLCVFFCSIGGSTSLPPHYSAKLLCTLFLLCGGSTSLPPHCFAKLLRALFLFCGGSTSLPPLCCTKLLFVCSPMRRALTFVSCDKSKQKHALGFNRRKNWKLPDQLLSVSFCGSPFCSPWIYKQGFTLSVIFRLLQTSLQLLGCVQCSLFLCFSN